MARIRPQVIRGQGSGVRSGWGGVDTAAHLQAASRFTHLFSLKWYCLSFRTFWKFLGVNSPKREEEKGGTRPLGSHHSSWSLVGLDM